MHSKNYISLSAQNIRQRLAHIVNLTQPTPNNYTYTKTLGTSESRRLFELSMKEGYVDAFIDKMMFYGSAGVGKTCSMSIVAGEDPPDVRNSTPIATRPATMYQMQETGGKWITYESKERMGVCAHISKHVLGRELIDTLAKSKRKVAAKSTSKKESESVQGKASTSDPKKEAQIEATQQHHDVPIPKSKPQTPSSESLVDPNVLKVIHDVLDEMFELIDQCPDTEEPITYIHKLLVSDCGGQPQFHEVLPIFLRKMSMIIFVFKLSEDLCSRPMIEYFEDGKPLGTPYESDHTTEQLFQQGLRSLHTHRSSKDKGDDSPKIVVLGTHEDEEHKCKESRQTKNRKLREMMLPTFEKEIVYYQPDTGDVVFPMNAKCPGRKEEDMAQAIRSRFSRENRSDKRQLPLQWLAFEIMLEEITLRLKRGVLSRNECLEVARRLHLDESALDAALMYLDELSLIFYYPDILPEVVFTNPQVLLDKISELVKVHHDKLKKYSGEEWQKFFCHALVTVEFLKQDVFEKHYVPGLFEPEHLVLLYRKLLIFAEFSEGKFFVPSLLRMLSSQEISDQCLPLDSLVAPLVLHFPDGPPRRGIFCALVSFLTSPENHFPGPWKLKMPVRSVIPDCLHRNCIQFMIPCMKTPCAITLIDTMLQFEVHLDVASPQTASKLCPAITHAISTGLRKANLALGYTNSTPSFALLCPCGKGDPHPATIGDGLWICTLDVRVGKEFAPNQMFWSTEDIAPKEQAGKYHYYSCDVYHLRLLFNTYLL